MRTPISAACNKRLILFAALTICMVFEALTPRTAWAHKVNVFAYVEGDTVVTQSYFSDGRKCRDSLIEVFNKKGEKLIEGTTDEEGVFSFRIPESTDLLIRLTASMGHQAEYVVPGTDLPAAPLSSEDVPGTALAPETVIPEPVTEPEPETAQQVTTVAEVEQALDRALARQLAPLRRAIEETQSKQRFSDVVGAVGYILGLMGLVMYFRSRMRKSE